MISVWVPGVAKTKGSVDVQRGRRVTQSVQGSTAWATLVTQAVCAQYGITQPADPAARVVWHCPTGPVAVRLAFWLPVEPTAPRSGDADKLERNVLDALTKAGAYGDDVQVTELSSAKYGPDPAPGLLLSVWPATDGERQVWDRWARAQAMQRQGLTV